MKQLDGVYARARAEWLRLHTGDHPVFWINTATCAQAAGAQAVVEAIRDELAAHHLQAELIQTGCLGLCYLEPTAVLRAPGQASVAYGPLTPESARQVVTRCLLGADPCAELAIGRLDAGPPEPIPALADHPMMREQVRNVLRDCGRIDPENLEHYLANDGYQAFLRALQLEPEQIIEQLKLAGLRGRSGGGFPTWRKWEFCRQASGRPHYVLCNAHKGDPGAFANRALMESDPHSILEGMLIAGWTIGAERGFVYVASEYPLARRRLNHAIRQLRELGLLGPNILGSGFSFDITVRVGAGVFVCGEETAQIASIEGRRGAPIPRPPYPGQAGLWASPTLVQNVETFANIPLILHRGGRWFRSWGTKASPGTKVFCLSGKLARRGLAELPLGTSLSKIVFEVGGGVRDGQPLKAVHIGGPPGGLLPPDMLDRPLDYDALADTGSAMGSGGIIALDADTCLVDLARHFLSFAQDEACGQCVPCRAGNGVMLDILNTISAGHGELADLERLQDLGKAIQQTSLCGLGQTAPNPVLAALRYFRPEFEAHIRGSCPARACSPNGAATRRTSDPTSRYEALREPAANDPRG